MPVDAVLPQAATILAAAKTLRISAAFAFFLRIIFLPSFLSHATIVNRMK
jgi:hypothetical protein